MCMCVCTYIPAVDITNFAFFIKDTMAFNRSLLLVECSMLNCLSTFPLSEFTSDSVKLMLSLLYSHLEDFPNIAGSHGSVWY